MKVHVRKRNSFSICKFQIFYTWPCSVCSRTPAICLGGLSKCCVRCTGVYMCAYYLHTVHVRIVLYVYASYFKKMEVMGVTGFPFLIQNPICQLPKSQKLNHPKIQKMSLMNVHITLLCETPQHNTTGK